MLWITPREAYETYAKQVSRPVRFDSFRRWITEGRVVSQKNGHRNEVLKSSAEAFGRLQRHTTPEFLRLRLEKASKNLGEPMFVFLFVDAEDDLDVTGTVAISRGDVKGLRDAALSRVDENTTVKRIAFKYDGVDYAFVAEGRITVCARSVRMSSKDVRALADAASTAVMERLCDELVCAGRLKYGPVTSDGTPTYQAV